MAFQMLGGVAGPGGGALRPQSARLLALLLLWRGRTVPIQTIEDTVWRGELVDAAAVHTAVSRLRSQLPAGTLHRKGDGYRLDAADHGCDVDDFERQLDAADQAPTPAEALAAADLALRAWSGTPFGTFGAEPAFLAETARLLDRHAHAIEVRATALFGLERFDEALDALAIPLADHPFHEGLRAIHVRALARRGRRVEALREIELYRRRLAEETGLSPSGAILALERELLADDGPGTARVETVAVDGRTAAFDTAAFPIAPGIRRRERSVVQRLVIDALAGTPRMVMVSGEPGYGKSTLALGVRDLAKSLGCRVVSGRASSMSPLALSCWGSLGREARREAPVVDAASRRSVLVDAVLERVAAACTAGPVAVVLEDVHWADDVSLEALEALHGIMEEQLLVVVVTTRTSGLDDTLRPTIARLARDPAVAEVRLGPLDAAEVGFLATDLLGRTPPAAMVHELERQSAGSPLLVRLMCEGIRAKSSLDDVRIPADLRSPYKAAIAALPAATKELTYSAALFGDRVELALLADVRATTIEVVRAELWPAVVASLVRFESTHVEFEHDLARRAVLAELGGGERQARHARLAARLVELCPDPSLASRERIGVVALQLQGSGLLAPRSELIAWSVAAGEVAAADSLWREASRHFGVAVDAGARPDVLPRLGEAQFMALDPEAWKTFTAVLESFDTGATGGGVSGAELDAVLRLHRLAALQNDGIAEARRRVDRLLQRLDPVVDRLARLRVLAQLAEFAIDHRDPLAEVILSESTSLLLDGDPPELVFQMNFAAGLVRTQSLDLARAIEAFRRADRVDWPGRLGEPRIREAQAHLVSGMASEALRCVDESLEASLRARRFDRELLMLLAQRANAACVLGDDVLAEATLAEAARWISRGDAVLSTGHLFCVAAWLTRKLGRPLDIDVLPAVDPLSALVATPPAARDLDKVQALLHRFTTRPLPRVCSALATVALAAELAADHGDGPARASLTTQLDALWEKGVRSMLAWPEDMSSLRRRLQRTV